MARRLTFILTGIALFMGACDTAPGPQAWGVGPVVSDLQYDPPAIVVGNLPPGSVTGETVSVPMTLSVMAADEDGDLQSVAWYLRGPESLTAPIAKGMLAKRADGRYAGSESLTLPVAVTGRYSIVVYATDREGRLSNEVRGAMDLLADGRPPVIEGIEMPERIVRPAPGEAAKVLSIVAAVTDPDGAANVLRVETRVNGRSTLFLCDDGSAGSCNAGSASGDQTAGDGRFTLTLQVDATNSAGTNTFVFTAIDRSGLRSESITRTIVLE